MKGSGTVQPPVTSTSLSPAARSAGSQDEGASGTGGEGAAQSLSTSQRPAKATCRPGPVHVHRPAAGEGAVGAPGKISSYVLQGVPQSSGRQPMVREARKVGDRCFREGNHTGNPRKDTNVKKERNI